MPRRTPSSLRGPTPEPASFRAVSADLARFVKDNVRPPRDPGLLDALPSDAAPPAGGVTTADLIRRSGRDPIQPGDVVRRGSPVAEESLGALLAPIKVARYSLQAAASHAGPFVASSNPEQFAYGRTGDGKQIVPGCPGCSGGGPHVS